MSWDFIERCCNLSHRLIICIIPFVRVLALLQQLRGSILSGFVSDLRLIFKKPFLSLRLVFSTAFESQGTEPGAFAQVRRLVHRDG